MTADVVVIGGGFTGLSAALELAGAGMSVVVLEAGKIGAGASGRNGGQVCTGFSPGQARLETQVTKADASACFDIAEEAKRLDRSAHRQAQNRLQSDVGISALHSEADTDGRCCGSGSESMRRSAIPAARCSTSRQLQAKLGSELYHGALREPRAGHFHTLNYLTGLAAAAHEGGRGNL